ncbi:MAG: oligopeptide:H+ symporter [Pseudomonadota bacterium]
MKKPHETALNILTLIQFCERFCFYAVVSSLILFFSRVYRLDDTVNYGYFAAFFGLSFGFSVVGGWLADKVYSYIKIIGLGLILVCIGSFILILLSPTTFFYGLACMSIGVGFFKPNITSLVGLLFEKDSARRSEAYTIFYMGINLGSFIGIILSSLMLIYFSWRSVFFIAWLASLSGLIIFLVTQKYFAPLTHKSINKHTKITQTKLIQSNGLVSIGCVILVYISYLLIIHSLVTAEILIGLFLVGILYIFKALMQQHLGKQALAFLLLLILNICFFALFQQLLSSINLFTDRTVDRDLFGFIVPTTSLQSINPVLVVLFGPLVILLWKKLRQINWEPSISGKFSWSFVFCVAAFATLAASAYFAAISDGKSNFLALILTYVFMTLGELFIGPIGLTAVTQLASDDLLAFMLGIWYLGTAIGNYFSGILAGVTTAISDKISPIAHHTIAKIYAFGFFELLLMSIFVLIFALFCQVLITKYLKIEF